MSPRVTTPRTILQAAFTLLALVGAGYYTCKHWHEVVLVWQSSRLSVLVLASVMTTSGYILRGVMWFLLLRGVTGITVSPLAAFRISSIAWMGRYIPGKLWALAGKAYMSADSRDGVVASAVAEGLQARAGAGSDKSESEAAEPLAEWEQELLAGATTAAPEAAAPEAATTEQSS